jgi:hypothetical protein
MLFIFADYVQGRFGAAEVPTAVIIKTIAYKLINIARQSK